jgi:hypothetical protein
MTEDQWLSCADPTPMLEALRASGKAPARKLRLWAVACCRRIWSLLTDERSRQAVEVAERFADGQAAQSERKAARTGALDATVFPNDPTAAWAAQRISAWRIAEVVGGTPESGHEGAPGAAVDAWASEAYGRVRRAGGDGEAAERAARADERRAQAALLRDVFGPLLFRRVTVAPPVLRWHGGTVVRLARAAYEGRRLPAGTLEPERLAVLADALEDAGCQDAQVLGHLRGPGAHVRGCWVIDLCRANREGAP